jgi:uncharacterized protein YegJ (DUF2314 family)
VSEKVFMFNDNDPEMQKAYQMARKTFRYFWREIAWERRRIVPGLDLACVKAPFTDGRRKDGNPDFEQMWIDQVDFDGQHISGVLLNQPNWLTSYNAGDCTRLSLNEMSDWMYAVQGEVFGAYTVNLMRARMSSRERKEHDAAWGLDFGDPAKIRLAPEDWFKGGKVDGEHPMSENMAPSFQKQLKENPSMVNQPDDLGWTFLHHQALAGSAATVKVLLEAGADVNAKTEDGKTALDLAKSLGWDSVITLLKAR